MRRIVTVARDRNATLADADSLVMYRVCYLGGDGSRHIGWQQYDPGSMEALIRRYLAEKMGCRTVPRDPEKCFHIQGVSAQLLPVHEDALVKIVIPGARKVKAWPTNPQTKSHIEMESKQQDLYFKWRVPVVSECTVSFLLGGQILRDLAMMHHHDDQLITLR